MMSTYRVVLSYLGDLNKESGVGKSKYLVDMSDLMRKLVGETYVFFDTETTGLDQHADQITEIAAVAVKGPDFEVLDKMHKKISLTDKTLNIIKQQRENPPTDPKKWTVERVLEFNKYNENPSEPEPEQSVLVEFKNFCAKHNALLVAHNAEFDMRMIGTKVGKIPNRGVWDSMLLARFLFHPILLSLEKNGDETASKILASIRNSKGKPQATLGKVLQALGLSIEGWHTALADVTSTVKVFKGILDYLKEHAEVSESPEYKGFRSKAFKRVLDFKRNKNKGNPGL